ncbi:unnamed protein product [Rhodiola kirilowii]
MEKPIKVESLDQSQHSRRLRSYPSSPEFEFWMVRNPSLPQPNMLTADELFVDGVLLPLDLVPVSAATVISLQESESASADVAVGPELTAASASEPVTGSRRWKDMFKKASKEIDDKVESKSTKMNKKRERKLSSGGGGTSSAELNINIWPFSRSRSAGTGAARPKVATGSRKISSAPCSRSNSGGESKSRKWPASPGRAGVGVHVGRSSPVWQVRTRPSKAAESRKGKPVKVSKEGSSGAYGGDFGRRGCSRKVSGGSIDGTGVVNLFSLRSLFSKKVY